MASFSLKGLVAALRGKPKDETPEELEQRAAAARAGAQKMADKLPPPLMPKAGLAEDKRRKAMIDRQLEEGRE